MTPREPDDGHLGDDAEAEPPPSGTTGSEGGGSDAGMERPPSEDPEAGKVRRKSPSRERRDVG